MAHELEIINGEASFVSVREPAWHGLGTIVEDALTAEDALEMGKLNWDVKLAPATVQIDNQIVELDGKRLTYRDHPVTGQPVPLGVVGSLYRPIQNREAFEILDAIVDTSGAHYETAGVLKGGRKVFMIMTMPDTIQIGGHDPVGLFLSATTSHDGTSALEIMTTPVRIVCANTARLAHTQAQSVFPIRHFANAQGKIAQARKALELTSEYFDEWASIANRLADIDMTHSEVESFLTELFPEGDSKVSVTKAENTRQQIMSIYDSSSTQQNIKGNAWGTWNAVAEYYDHFRPVRNTGGNSFSETFLRADAMFNDSITTKKTRAAQLLLNAA